MCLLLRNCRWTLYCGLTVLETFVVLRSRTYFIGQLVHSAEKHLFFVTNISCSQPMVNLMTSFSVSPPSSLTFPPTPPSLAPPPPASC